jgi:hypothetical protein
MDWVSAVSFCHVFGMTLASLETQEEHDHLLSLAKNLDSQVYIGGTDIGSEGQFYWISSGQPIDYPVKWKAGEPNNVENTEHCLQLWIETDGYRINDHVRSGNRQPFICELFEERP